MRTAIAARLRQSCSCTDRMMFRLMSSKGRWRVGMHDDAFDLNHGGDIRLPLRPTTAGVASNTAMVRVSWRLRRFSSTSEHRSAWLCCKRPPLLTQGQLIVFELNDQMRVPRRRLRRFFLTMHRIARDDMAATSSSSSSFCTAGSRLIFRRSRYAPEPKPC